MTTIKPWNSTTFSSPGLLNSPIVTSTPTKAPSSTSERNLTESDCKGYFIPTASTLVEFVHEDGSDSNDDENVESSQSKPMVGGLDKELKVIGEAVSAGLQCNPYVGLLLYGPSGTGKSTLARSLPAAFGWQVNLTCMKFHVFPHWLSGLFQT